MVSNTPPKTCTRKPTEGNLCYAPSALRGASSSVSLTIFIDGWITKSHLNPLGYLYNAIGKSMNIAILYTKLAPFHFSRLEVAGRFWTEQGARLTCIEVAREQSNYGWSRSSR